MPFYNTRNNPLYRKRKQTPAEIARENAALLVGIIVLVGIFFTVLQWGDPVDDAYVSFVYAKNLALGRGLVFNPMERVEGYSNFLWVILTWLGGYVYPIPDAAQVLGFIFGAANIVLVYFVARKSGLGRVRHVAMALYAIDLSASVWNVEGLETPLYVFLILLTLLLYLRSRSKGFWALPALGAAMTRPEGAAVFGAMALHSIVQVARRKRKIDSGDVAAIIIFIAGFGAYNAWRIIYFEGSVLPNTFFARGGFSGPLWGALYLAYSLFWGRSVGAILMAGLIILGLIVNLRRRALKEGVVLDLGPVLSWFAVGIAVILATGGDWMPNGRFLVPILPAFYILCAHGLRFFRKPAYYYSLAVLLLATNVFAQMSYGRGDSFEKRWSRDQASFYMPVAEWLIQHEAAGKKTALSDVGYITYYSGIYAIDTLGLTNKHLARVKGGSAWATDVNYVLEQRPAYIIRMVRDYGDGAELGHTAFDREVIKDKRFMEDYKQVAVIPGYLATERSLGDFKKRSYKVTFRIYAGPPPIVEIQ